MSPVRLVPRFGFVLARVLPVVRFRTVSLGADIVAADDVLLLTSVVLRVPAFVLGRSWVFAGFRAFSVVLCRYLRSRRRAKRMLF